MLFIALIAMGLGVFLIGQTVSPNFFKKIFSPQKVSVAKDSAESKQNSSRRGVIKKPVVDEAEKNFSAFAITCPANPTFCSTNGTDYTYVGTALNPTTDCVGGLTSSTYTSSGAGVSPSTGSGIATLNN